MKDLPTREEILAVPAGRRLDGWVAQLVLGIACEHSWREDVYAARPGWYCGNGQCGAKKDRNESPPTFCYGLVGCYSTDLAAAWLVVEHLRERFGQVELYGERNHFWDCVVSDWGGMTVLAREGAETPMLAVCRAALAAMPAGGKS
jgi:hypothetical protein